MSRPPRREATRSFARCPSAGEVATTGESAALAVALSARVPGTARHADAGGRRPLAASRRRDQRDGQAEIADRAGEVASQPPLHRTRQRRDDDLVVATRGQLLSN